jgi:hypothetical protein
MTAKVVGFKPASVGSGFRFDSDEILEQAKGQSFITFAIIGELEDGTIWTDGNANPGETLVPMERAKHHLVFGED